MSERQDRSVSLVGADMCQDRASRRLPGEGHGPRSRNGDIPGGTMRSAG
jgi:hypothetical protein